MRSSLHVISAFLQCGLQFPIPFNILFLFFRDIIGVWRNISEQEREKMRGDFGTGVKLMLSTKNTYGLKLKPNQRNKERFPTNVET